LNIFGVFVLVVKWTVIVIIVIFTHDNNRMAKCQYCPLYTDPQRLHDKDDDTCVSSQAKLANCREYIRS